MSSSSSSSAELDWFFRFRDPLLREELREFTRSRGLSRFFVLVLLVVNAGMAPLALYLFFCAVLAPLPLHSPEYRKNVALSLGVVLLVAALIFVSWAIASRSAQTARCVVCRCVTIVRNLLHSLSPALFPAFVPLSKISGHCESLRQENEDKSLSLSVSRRLLSFRRVAPLPQYHAAPSSAKISSPSIPPSPFAVSPSPKPSAAEKKTFSLPPPLCLPRMSHKGNAVADESGRVSSQHSHVSKASAPQKRGQPTPATTPTVASSKKSNNTASAKTQHTLAPRGRIDYNALFVALSQILYFMFFVSHALAIHCPATSSSPSSTLSAGVLNFFSPAHPSTYTPTLNPTYIPLYAPTLSDNDVNILDWTQLKQDLAGLRSVVFPQAQPLCENAENYVLYHSLIMLLLPCLFFISLPDLSIEVVWFALSSTLFVIVAVVISLEIHTVSLILGIYMCFAVCVIIDLQIYRVKSFGIYRRLSAILEEKERNAEANHVAEMRHMIANVAHDLKTPLASFMTGLDVIEMTISDFRQDLMGNYAENNEHDTFSSASQNGTLFQTQQQSGLESISTCLTNIRNTHAFMMMTINRCLDYAKASRGLRLVPRYEPFSLQEALQLPLQCVRNLQSRIRVCMDWEALPSTVCACIITDKQWLQENLLCLLSNAVKYSAEGQVDVSVYLEEVSGEGEDERENGEEDDGEEENDRNSKDGGNKVDEFVSGEKRGGDERSASSRGEKDLESDQNSNSGRNNTNKNNKITKTNMQPGSVDSPMNSKMQSGTEQTVKGRDGSAGKGGDVNLQFLRFEVQDTGIGMSEEEMLSLFNPFKQTQRLAGGTGLGLYSLAKRVEALRGRYGVQRRRDGLQGSLFWLSIPYKPDEMFAEHQRCTCSNNISFPHSNTADVKDTHTHLVFTVPKLSRAISSVSPSRTLGNYLESDRETETEKGKEKSVVASHDSHSYEESVKVSSAHGSDTNASLVVLLVDDSPAILKMTSMMLRKLGHEVVTAENGAVAVKLVRERWEEQLSVFDVVLMDLQMPVMDGLEATTRIRESEGDGQLVLKPRQAIVGMSANSDEETMQHAYAAGMDAFIPKPFRADALRVVLNHTLNNNNDNNHK